MPEAKPDTIKVIINPQANHGRTRALIPAIHAGLAGWAAADFVVTEYPRQALAIAGDLGDNIAFVVVAGGDGSIFEVVNGLAKAGKLNTPLGIIPTGTGNDLCKALGIPHNLTAAFKRLQGKRRKKIDLGRVNGYLYTNSLAIGFDARVAHLANEIKDEIKRSGILLYLTALFRIIFHDYYCHDVRIRIDKGKWRKTSVLLVAVNNGRVYGGGFKITPDADITDGLLDVCIIDALPRWQVFLRLPFAIAGRHRWMKPAHFYKAKSVEIESEHNLPAALDGELILDKRFRVDVIPSALTIF